MFEVGRWIEKQYLVVERHRGWRWILYIVQDRISENVFVIKTPSGVLPFDASAMARFADKARIWIGTGEHDEIVKAFLLREFEGIPHLFLEYMDGPSLADILSARPGKPLPIDQTVTLMRQLIKGMKFLHGANLSDGGRGVVHGNLTPRNILTKSGNIKITDIGLADPFRQSAETINADLLLSKISYMAPEQIEDPRRTDNLTDIYSFGAIMYEVATGTRPMSSMRPGDPLAEVIRFEPFPPSRRNRSCPRWLEETILKCMARKPENRFQSFEHIDTFVGKLLELGEMEQAPTAKEKKSARVYRIAHVRGVAKKESRGLDQYYLGVEHLMLGLLAEEESLVVSCFGDKVTAEQLRSGIISHLPKGEGPWYWDGLRKTPRYKRVMKLARKIKRESAHEHMLPQHLLLAILEEGRNVPVRVLRELKVDIKDAIGNLRREIRRRRPGI
ncbi:MAG: protein kinase, partial [Candidatus Hydrogenedentota bacterium]